MTSKERQYILYEKRSHSGLCTNCGESFQHDGKKMCPSCRKQRRDYMREYHHRPEVHERWLTRVNNNRNQNLEQSHINERNYRQRLKEEVFSHYGSKCACCGETQIEFLTIDHINNDGKEHRQQLNHRGGARLYSWIKQHNYPDTLQILCWNCNCAKAHFGKCPHQKTKELI